jgi:hypothetical protein
MDDGLQVLFLQCRLFSWYSERASREHAAAFGHTSSPVRQTSTVHSTFSRDRSSCMAPLGMDCGTGGATWDDRTKSYTQNIGTLYVVISRSSTQFTLGMIHVISYSILTNHDSITPMYRYPSEE